MNKQKKIAIGTNQHRLQASVLRNFIIAIVGFALITAIIWSIVPTAPTESTHAVNNTLPKVTVYKSASCGCCRAWVTHLEREGFNVTSYNRDNMDSIKTASGVKPHLSSCHTALVGGYVIEGHVPAVDIIQLLQDKPDFVGLAAPGMPKYSPGMQAAGREPRGYDVLLFDKAGNTSVYKHY